MANSPFKSKSFVEHFAFLQGVNVEIDFINQKLHIYDRNKNILDTIKFSHSIKDTFTVHDLFKSDNQKGDKVYSVYPDGFENRNWLWAGEIVEIL